MNKIILPVVLLIGKLSWDLSNLGDDEGDSLCLRGELLCLILLGELKHSGLLISGLMTEHTVVSSSVSDISLSTNGL